MKLNTFYLAVIGIFGWWGFGDDDPPVEAVEIVESPEVVETPQLNRLNPSSYPFIHAPDTVALNDQIAGDCAACHADTYEQWFQSPHRTGLKSEALKASWKAHSNQPECTRCHLPLVSQHSQLATSYVDGQQSKPIFEANPNFNPTLYSESVGCASCHMRDGLIVGNAFNEAPHSLIESPELATSSACMDCHQATLNDYNGPTYNTYQEWTASSFAKAGVQCQGCHMSTSPSTGSLTSALTQSGHLIELSPRQALSVTFQNAPDVIQRGEENTFVITIHNSGAGHSMPSGSPFEDVNLSFRVLINDKDLQAPFNHPLGITFSDDVPHQQVSNTRIPADGHVSLQVPVLIDQKKESGFGLFQISYNESNYPIVLVEYPIEIR